MFQIRNFGKAEVKLPCTNCFFTIICFRSSMGHWRIISLWWSGRQAPVLKVTWTATKSSATEQTKCWDHLWVQNHQFILMTMSISHRLLNHYFLETLKIALLKLNFKHHFQTSCWSILYIISKYYYLQIIIYYTIKKGIY